MDRTAQDWPWDPRADEASLGVCIAGLCGLTLGWSTDLVPTAQTGLSPSSRGPAQCGPVCGDQPPSSGSIKRSL